TLSSDLGRYVWISTFHSFAARVLRIEAKNIAPILQKGAGFTVFDETDQKSVIRECMKELNIDHTKLKLGMFLDAIQRAKDDLIDAESYSIYALASNDTLRKIVTKLYLLYQEKLKQANAVDFGDLLLKLADVFYNFPKLKEKYQTKFKYVLVDEYQDINRAQYILIKHLVAKHKNICVVGDEDQAIYSWRGANVKNILEFEKEYPQAKVVKLEQNYRSTKNILDCAQNVIRNNTLRKKKKLYTKIPAYKKVEFCKFETELDEAKFIAKTINELCTENKLHYKDFAVFYRINAQSRVLEDAFIKEKIPYIIVGTIRFYERKEIKDIVSYLRFLINPKDELSLKRIINVPRRGIGKETVKKVDEYAKKHKISLWESLQAQEKQQIKEFVSLVDKLRDQIKNLSPVELVKFILDETGYLEELKSEDTYEARERIRNLGEFISAVKEYIDLNPDSDIGSFLQNIALFTEIDSYTLDKSQIDAVTLMTVHLAKGLEFDTVFITGLEEGLFPIGTITLEEDMQKLEEERRLCYVGMTRAKRCLYLSFAESRRLFGQITFNIPSRFFTEAQQTTEYSMKITILDNNRQIGQRVKHPEFGAGRIIKVMGNDHNPKLIVKFDNFGIKTLAAKYANLELLSF
ncbi:MAG: 3'-5' exonuclease, partial [Elusimicrobiota bacterium]|nr:3'-5' exonuclease [Elusimicrobiota bacterium]